MRNVFVVVALAGLPGCSADGGGDDGGPRLRVILDLDPSQERLDNFGEPAPTPPAGHAAQDPEFLLVGGHSLELSPGPTTALGAGEIVFDSPEREGAVDFAELPVVAPGEELWSGPLADVAPGTYEYLRLSVSFQRYRVTGWADFMGTPVSADVEIASFVESSTYIDAYEIGDESVAVGGVKDQGYYGAWSTYTGVVEGQAPVGATTVPNPIDATSPIPVDSCVVTAAFDAPLTLDPDGDGDVTIRVTLSSNGSFEWEDGDGDGNWQPFAESVVDMGLRGMQVSVE